MGCGKRGNKHSMCSDSNIAIVSVPGDLDVTTARSVRRQVDDAIGRGCRRVILNMDAASYVDSAGMGLIVVELRRLRAMGGLLSLVNVRPQVYKTLALMRLVDVMPVAVAGAKREVRDLDPSVLPVWQCTLGVDPSRLSDARGRIEELLSSMPFSADEVFDVTLAVGEAMGNAVDHTDKDGVLATVTAYPDRAVVDVSDCGKGFSLGSDEELPTTGKHAERGRGIRLMRMLVDSVSISLKPTGHGTVVRLTKLVPPQGGAR